MASPARAIGARLAGVLRRMARVVEPSRPRTRAQFGGAQFGRLYGDWVTGNYSPDFEIRGYNQTLRARARQLVRDNPHGSGYLNELANNVIGAEGILLEAHVTTMDGSKARPTNVSIERAFADWGKARNTTVNRRTSWKDAQRLVIRTMAMDGEVFLRKVPYFRNDHAFALQFIDADQVDDFYNRAPGPDTNEIRMGVEIDTLGAPVAYHVWSRQLGDNGQRERIRIAAEEIIHLFIPYRAQQTRGVTMFAPALTNLRQLDGYTEAELVAARSSAEKFGIILNHSEGAIEAYETPLDGEEATETKSAAGTFEELGPGQELEMYDPKHPSIAFKDFVKAVLRGVARGLNMAYTTLTGDLEAVNYSSIRAGLLSERDHYKTLQGFLVEHLHEEVYSAWLPNAILAGALTVDARLTGDLHAVRWRGRGWKWVDPKNDLIAGKLAIDLGLASRTRLAAEQGIDLEELFEELAHEKKLAAEKGIDVSGEQVNATGKSASLWDRFFEAEEHDLSPVAARTRRRLRSLTGTGE